MMAGNWNLTVAADLDNLGKVRDFIEQVGTEVGLQSDPIGNLLLAVDEAVTNIIFHGYKSNPGEIGLECEQSDGKFIVRLRDSAPVYNPIGALAPDLSTSPLERSAAGGFGIVLIKSLVDEVQYQTMPDGRNELTLIYQGPPPGSAGAAVGV